MASDEWRMCVDWLVRCRILPEDHRATRPESEAFDLAQALRDGVLICHLLNNIHPGVIDARDFSARPQLSQFLCLKNIRTFLQTCKREFGLRDHDLFDPPDLFDVKDFRKVLHTLSKLSKTEIAQSKFADGFRSQNKHIAGPDYYNLLEELANNGFPPENTGTWRGRHHDDDEDIYGNLPDMALENDLDDNEEIYDRVYQEDDEEIYEDLCSTRRSKRVSGTQPASELPSPVTKKDHCIKELYDTEKNYVDALKMLVQHFIKPLKDVIPQQERDIIFAHIEKLLEVHKSFLIEIQLACVSGSVKLYDVFVKYKTKLLVYGDYCSNLPIAQEKIDEVLKKGEAIKIQIEACEKKANEGKFKLRDLLHVPMQRVLKYHLLLKELLKSSEKQSEEHKGLEMALEAMQDLSLYVNEVKRDNETLQLIGEIQNSIGDLQMPPNTSLKDYGRLQKDGELKVKNHTDNRLRSRYIFLFDKVMLMCKSKGETYNFKEAIILSEYKVHDGAALKDLQKKVDKWNCAFIMAKKNDKNAYTFYAKTDDMRSKWIEAIRLALENTEIPAGTNYVMHTFEKPTECNVCGKLLRGVFFQGYQCQETKVGVHKECIGKSPAEKCMPPVPPRIQGQKSVTPSRLNLRSSESTKKSSLFRSQVRALVDYTGKPPPGGGRPPLKFHKDDVLKILNNSDSQWWKGHLHGEEGWFPQHLVQEEQIKVTRKPSYLPVKLKTERNGTMSPPSAHPPATNNIGYVNVPDEESLSSHKWFVGPMDRDTAVRRLNNLSNGTFLIRVSENPGRRGELSLSIKYDNQTRHIRVEKNHDNMFFLADTKFFHSLPELVEFYQINSLADSFPGVDTVLKFPVKAQTGFNGPNLRILGYCVAMYDYAATATTQLSLTRGDRVAIMSKTGSDKGWWKGEHCVTGKMGYFPLAYVREEDDD